MPDSIPVPDRAVQIMINALPHRMAPDNAALACTALARAGWLHDPAELNAARARVAALEAVAEAAREVDEILHEEDQIWSNAPAAENLAQRLLDAVPAAETMSGEANNGREELRLAAERVLTTHSLPQYGAQDHDEAIDTLAAAPIMGPTTGRMRR